MASTFKVMLMVAYLRQDGVEDRALTNYEKDADQADDPPLGQHQRDDDPRHARSRPDRVAGRHGARMKHFKWNDIWGYCKTSARDQAFFMRNLQALRPEPALGLRQAPARAHRRRRSAGGSARSNLPPGWDLYFKGGWGIRHGAVDHQVVLLRNKRRRVGLAVLTEGNPVARVRQRRPSRAFSQRLLRGLPQLAPVVRAR